MLSMREPVKPRSYDSSSRRARSEQTRQRIIDTARTVMLEYGYRATTIAEISGRAGVHVDTVYRLVGRKPVLLRELIEQAISGTDHPIPAKDRGYVAAIRAEPDPRRKLQTYAAASCAIHPRLAPLLAALRDASTTEPEAEQVWQQINERRATNMVELAEDLQRAGGLRPGLSVTEAADVIWATNSAELYLLLVNERGWSMDHYERWLGDTWIRLLLPDADQAEHPGA